MPTPWDKNLPNACSEPQVMKPEDLLFWVKIDEEQRAIDKDYITIIDLRGADNKGGIIPYALNIPAENFFQCMIPVFKMIAAANITQVCFCDASSDGRAKRMGGLFQDFGGRMKDVGYQMGDITTYELEGGMEAWVAAGEEYTEWLNDYDPAAWKK